MRLVRLALFISITVASVQAQAAFVSGKVNAIFLSASTNFAFRINMTSGIPGCKSNFAYINVGGSGNYEAYVSSLTSAYLAGKTVGLTYTVQSDGYCLINEFGVSD